MIAFVIQFKARTNTISHILLYGMYGVSVGYGMVSHYGDKVPRI